MTTQPTAAITKVSTVDNDGLVTTVIKKSVIIQDYENEKEIIRAYTREGWTHPFRVEWAKKSLSTLDISIREFGKKEIELFQKWNKHHETKELAEENGFLHLVNKIEEEKAVKISALKKGDLKYTDIAKSVRANIKTTQRAVGIFVEDQRQAAKELAMADYLRRKAEAAAKKAAKSANAEAWISSK